MHYRECQFDGLIGPSHHFGGLAQGNLASAEHAGRRSNPRAAALEGITKMRLVHELGIPQYFIPPLPAPRLNILRECGFSGSDQEIIRKAAINAPALLSAAYSAASMWTANAATVCPSIDSSDRRVHFTTANLCSALHRSLESTHTQTLLKNIFPDINYFVHHNPLPANTDLSDEGAANHGRLAAQHNEPGIHLFIYGRKQNCDLSLLNYLPRQSLLASETIARQHLINPDNCIFIPQNPAALNAGVFHNDVISVANQDQFLYHERAFINTPESIHKLQELLPFLQLHCVQEKRVSLEDAVSSYLFNSQLLSLENNKRLLLAPQESQEITNVATEIKYMLDTGFIDRVQFVSLRQSMSNGGGPACLRLRVLLNEAEEAAVHQPCRITEQRLNELERWIRKHYRDELRPTDLADPQFLQEVHHALSELGHMLELGDFYS